jgi:hypothetical protein
MSVSQNDSRASTMRGDSLYFPSIAFQSLEWLKCSLLIWDHVYRIVPRDYPLRDHRDVALAEDEGVVRRITPDDVDRLGAKERFERATASFVPAGFYPDEGTEALAAVHLDKIDARLYGVLEELAGKIEGDWMYVPPQIARGYMLSLALEVSSRRNMTVSTDNTDAWIATSFLTEAGAINEYVYDRSADSHYCQLGLSDILPFDVSTLSMDEVVRLSKQSADERAALRLAINDLSARMESCEDAVHAKQLVIDFRQGLSGSVEALRRQNRQLMHSRVLKYLGIGVRLSGSVVAALLGAPEVAVANLGLGATMEVVSAVSERAKTHVPQDRIAAYLLEAGGVPHDRSIGPSLRARMEEFVND